jgi:predicted transcriptional regulator
LPSAKRSDQKRSSEDLEQTVLQCLSAAEHGFTAAEAQMALGYDLAYATVFSILGRLHKQKLVNRVLDGRAFRYALSAGAAGASAHIAAQQMLRLLDTADRHAVFGFFVAELSVDDRLHLGGLLKEPECRLRRSVLDEVQEGSLCP